MPFQLNRLYYGVVGGALFLLKTVILPNLQEQQQREIIGFSRNKEVQQILLEKNENYYNSLIKIANMGIYLVIAVAVLYERHNAGRNFDPHARQVAQQRNQAEENKFLQKCIINALPVAGLALIFAGIKLGRTDSEYADLKKYGFCFLGFLSFLAVNLLKSQQRNYAFSFRRQHDQQGGPQRNNDFHRD